MMNETQGRRYALRYPVPARAGWLLACDAPDNIAKGQTMIDGMAQDDHNHAITYRDHCLDTYAVCEPGR